MSHNSEDKETLDTLNSHFLHFLPYSIKTLYLTQRDSCWKATKALSTLFFPPSEKVACYNKGLEGGGHLKKESSFWGFTVRNTFVHLIPFKHYPYYN